MVRVCESNIIFSVRRPIVMLLFWLYFSGLSNRILRKSIKSLETGASLGYMHAVLAAGGGREHVFISFSNCDSLFTQIPISSSSILSHFLLSQGVDAKWPTRVDVLFSHKTSIMYSESLESSCNCLHRWFVWKVKSYIVFFVRLYNRA